MERVIKFPVERTAKNGEEGFSSQVFQLSSLRDQKFEEWVLNDRSPQAAAMREHRTLFGGVNVAEQS
jgi:hypothetical protein